MKMLLFFLIVFAVFFGCLDLSEYDSREIHQQAIKIAYQEGYSDALKEIMNYTNPIFIEGCENLSITQCASYSLIFDDNYKKPFPDNYYFVEIDKNGLELIETGKKWLFKPNSESNGQG